jgi:hypothetical protein
MHVWIFTAIAVAAVVLAVFDVFWPFTVALLLVGGLVWWFEHFDTVIAWLRPEFIAAYVVIGFVWVFFKWTRVVEEAWRSAKAYGSKEPKPPKWSEHSYDFAAYFFYWPLDLIAYLLSDFIQEAWRHISAMVARSFDRYAEWRFTRIAAKQAVAKDSAAQSVNEGERDVAWRTK